jgi:hypothetical protein
MKYGHGTMLASIGCEARPKQYGFGADLSSAIRGQFVWRLLSLRITAIKACVDLLDYVFSIQLYAWSQALYPCCLEIWIKHSADHSRGRVLR